MLAQNVRQAPEWRVYALYYVDDNTVHAGYRHGVQYRRDDYS
jgi:hypothetical protein